MLLQLSHFFPSIYSPLPCTPHSNSIPLLLSSWVGHVSSLASPFPTLFLTCPCLFSTYHLCFLFPVPFPPSSPLLLPADNPPCELHFCDSVPILVVCLVCFCFCFRFHSWWLWVCCHFTVHIFDDLTFLRYVPLTFHMTRAWWWWNPLTWVSLSGKHFICPFFLNDSFAG